MVEAGAPNALAEVARLKELLRTREGELREVQLQEEAGRLMRNRLSEDARAVAEQAASETDRQSQVELQLRTQLQSLNETVETLQKTVTELKQKITDDDLDITQLNDCYQVNTALIEKLRAENERLKLTTVQSARMTKNRWTAHFQQFSDGQTRLYWKDELRQLTSWERPHDSCEQIQSADGGRSWGLD